MMELKRLMSRSIPWLDKYAEQLKKESEKAKKTKTASAKKQITASKIKRANKIILKKDVLPKAINGNTVKYNGFMWKVINASYKDKKGPGIMLEKVAEISTKKVTDPADYARTDPGDVYDYEVRDSYEVPELQETAANTEDRISQENALDRTTPAGRATDPYTNIFEDLIEEDFSEDNPAEDKDEVVEENVAEDIKEDIPAEHDMEENEEKKEASVKNDETVEVPVEEVPQKVAKKRPNPILASICGESKETPKANKSEKRQNPIIASIVEDKKQAKRPNPILANICK